MATDTQNYDTDQYINKWGHHDSVLKSHMWRTADNSCQYLVPTLKQMASGWSLSILLHSEAFSFHREHIHSI